MTNWALSRAIADEAGVAFLLLIDFGEAPSCGGGGRLGKHGVMTQASATTSGKVDGGATGTLDCK